MEKGEKVLCQSCGAENDVNDEKCIKCGALLPGRLMEKQRKREKEELQNSLLPEIARKIRDLEAEHEKRPEAVAICIQLSNAYKEAGLKDFAVEWMEKASKLDPDNKFLKQKVRMLIDGEKADYNRIVRIEKSEAKTKKYTRYALIGLTCALLIVAACLVKTLLFPSTFCLAGAKDKNETISPKFSSDGAKIAYLDQPRVSLLDAVDAMAGVKLKGETWIMVKPVKGKARKTLKLGDAMTIHTQFEWRPKHDEITFVKWGMGKDQEYEKGRHIYLVPASGGEPERLAAGSDFAWSRNGDYLAYVKTKWSFSDGNESGLYLLNMETRQEQKISSLSCSFPDWSKTTDELVFQGQDRARVMDMYRKLVDDAASAASQSDQSNRIERYVGDIYRFDLNSFRTVQISTGGTYRSPRFTPDGQKVVMLTLMNPENPQNILMIMKRDGSGQAVLLEPNANYEWFGQVAFSPDGKQIAFEGFFANPNMPSVPATETPLGIIGGETNYVSDIFIASINGSDMQRLESKHKYKSQPVYSPDGSLLAYQVMYLDSKREVWAMKR